MNSIRSRMTIEDFITKAREKHHNTYLYGAVEYNGNKHKVKILCPVHGYFWQTPDHHLNGCGCPSCAEYGFNPDKPAEMYIYQIINASGEYAGFGITGNPKSRHAIHARSFAATKSVGKLIYTLNLEKGAEAAHTEKILKDSLMCVDSGVVGFKTEAVNFSDLNDVLAAIENSTKKKPVSV